MDPPAGIDSGAGGVWSGRARARERDHHRPPGFGDPNPDAHRRRCRGRGRTPPRRGLGRHHRPTPGRRHRTSRETARSVIAAHRSARRAGQGADDAARAGEMDP